MNLNYLQVIWKTENSMSLLIIMKLMLWMLVMVYHKNQLLVFYCLATI